MSKYASLDKRIFHMVSEGRSTPVLIVSPVVRRLACAAMPGITAETAISRRLQSMTRRGLVVCNPISCRWSAVDEKQ